MKVKDRVLSGCGHSDGAGGERGRHGSDVGVALLYSGLGWSQPSIAVTILRPPVVLPTPNTEGGENSLAILDLT